MLNRMNWFRLFLLPIVFALAAVAPVAGKKEEAIPPPTEKKFVGMVEEVKQHTCEICHCVELSAIVKTDAGRIEVRLGPKTFFEERDFYLSHGDSIEVIGVPFTERGKNIVLANEVRKGTEHLVLRGKYGRPAWLEAHGHTCPVCGN
jgi:hypothetical protein